MVRRLKLAGALIVSGCLVAGTVAAAPAARPAAATVTRAGKGVSAWVFDGVNKALAKSGASWYYTWAPDHPDRKSTRLNSSHLVISYAVFCLKKKKKN